MRLGFLLSIVVVALQNVAGVTASEGQLSARSSTNATSTILTPDFVEIVQEIVDTEGIPGLTLAVVYKTGPPELGAWGIKSEDGTNMTTDTLFNLASCSKAFVSASLGILIDEFAHGQNTTPLPAGLSTLTWKTKCSSWRPSHDLSYKVNDSVVDITRNLRNLRPTFELREQWLYNNQMYMVGSYIVSTLSGIRFADFVNNRIFKPLGMSSSTYSIDAATQTGRFTDTWTSFGRLIPPWIQDEFEDLIAGPAGQVPWVKVFLNGGIDVDTNVTIIPPAEFDVVTDPHSIISNSTGESGLSTELYGLGWSRFSYVGHDIIIHNGAAPGVSAYIAAALSDGIGIIALANAGAKQPFLADIIIRVADKAFGLAASNSSPANQSTVKRSQRAGVRARADSAATLSYPDLAGTYFNAGYGTGFISFLSERSGRLPFCRQVSFAKLNGSVRLLGYSVEHTPPFYPTNGSQYSISVGTIYPEGYGKNTTPFSTLSPGATATFVVESETVVGFGVSGISGVERVGPVEKASDVWFVKQA
ncbi:beta-lactamase/transpeptidase-like protein [Russula compacta]|nr:beta-lactamase/transpeptidase-like protein [Russula compacta]